MYYLQKQNFLKQLFNNNYLHVHTYSYTIYTKITYIIKTGEPQKLLPSFDAEEEAQMKRMLQRVDKLAKHAMKRNVR